MQIVKKEDMLGLTGQEMEPSSWLEITQERVNKFAEATNDHQFIHVDPEKAAHSPFGGTIAHGFLTLSLLPSLLAENAPQPEGLVMGVNYGTDKLRFLSPVRVGSRVRALQKIQSVVEKEPGKYLIRTKATVEIENGPTPALIVETLGLLITE
jgi:acyl dehydratase